ncbi:MAG: NPXTG-anchored protein [Oscillospiraceae bacterium]|nr:NPXTG-anchored protein [Oscillospiraceae bacterium]
MTFKDTGKANPATGSVEFVNVAIALGTVSLAAAAAVVLKK